MTDILTNYNGGSGGGGLLYSSSNDTGPRGVSSLHRRADQLKRWEEREAQLRNENNQLNDKHLKRTKTKIKFSNKTLFLASCAFNDYEEVDRLLSNNLVNINDCNIDGLTALHQACIDDNLEMVEYLIKRGADVNSCDNEGWTPLHATASCGHTSIVRLLLENGANPTLVNNDGELALDVVDNNTIGEMIQAKLKELNIEDYDLLRKQEQIMMLKDVNDWIKNGVMDDKPHPRTGATILHVAASKGYIHVLGKLLNDKNLRSQVNVDAVDNEGWTPLAAAVYFQQPGSVELLLQRNANIEHKIGTGQSIMDLTDHELILRLLSDRKKLLDEQKLKAQQANGPQAKALPQSPPSVPTLNESETQRRAHARRVRETRRSTQGITADDVKEAMDQLKQANINVNNVDTITSTVTKVTLNEPVTTVAPICINSSTTTKTDQNAINTNTPSITPITAVTTATTTVTQITSLTTTTPSMNPPDIKSTTNSLSSLASTISSSIITTPTLSNANATIIKIGDKPFTTLNEKLISETEITPSTIINNKNENKEVSEKKDTVDASMSAINKNDSNKDSLVIPAIIEPTDNVNNDNYSNTDQNTSLVRRKRNKRRSTGTNPYDGVKAENSIDKVEEEIEKNQSEQVVNTLSTTPSINSNTNLPNNNKLNSEENKYTPTSAGSAISGTNYSRVRKEEKDYKKLYEELLEQHESYKKEMSKKEQEWNREKRQMQRKIGELEEECKQLDNFRVDNQRLKDENSALIRVISKLSK